MILHVRRDAVDAALRTAHATDDAGHVRPVLRIRTHDVGVAVPSLRRVPIVVADDGTWVVFQVETVVRLRVDLLLRVLELFGRDPGVGETQPHHLRLLRLGVGGLVRRDLRLRQRIGVHAATEELVRPRHHDRDLLDLLGQLLRFGLLLLELLAGSLARRRVRHWKLRCRRARRRVRAARMETRELERVVVHRFAVLPANEVPAVDVVGVPVVVVVPAVAGDFLRVRPQVRLEPRVRRIDRRHRSPPPRRCASVACPRAAHVRRGGR